LVVTNVGTGNDRVEPVRVANEEIGNEQEVDLENAMANEGTENFQVPPILEIAVANEGTENFGVQPVLEIAVANERTRKEKRYIPGPRSSKCLLPRVSGDQKGHEESP
jgi:hypothetical protein